MTGTEIVARANYLIDDEIDEVEALAELNLAIADLSLEAPFEDTYQATLAVDTRSITVPSDLVALTEVRVDGVQTGAATSPFATAADEEGTPSYYYLLGNTLNFYPLNNVTAGVTVDLLFLSAYTSLSSLSETSDIPLLFHMALVYWLADKFKLMDDEPNAASTYLMKYTDLKMKLKLYQETRTGEYWTTREG